MCVTTPLERYECYAARADRIGAARARRTSRHIFAILAAIVVVWMVLYALPLIVMPQGARSGMENAAADEANVLAVESSVYYPNCAAAQAAGKAPIFEGQPGYRAELDPDDDGIACEPYHSR